MADVSIIPRLPLTIMLPSAQSIQTRTRYEEIASAFVSQHALFPFWDHDSLISMRIIARKTLRAFWMLYPDSEQPLRAWFAEVHAARWRTPQAIKRRCRHASFVADNRVIFNIGGNKYRLVTHVNYDFQIVYIKFIGTHAEYDRIDPESL